MQYQLGILQNSIFFLDNCRSAFMVTLLTVLDVDCYDVASKGSHMPNRPARGFIF